MHEHPSIPLSRDQAREMLREHGLRATRQREDIYLALASTKCHKSADELFAEVRQSQPGISLATVYNTLEALAGAGLCRRLPSPSGASRYDADVTEHAHFVSRSGRVMDVPMDLSELLYGSIDEDVIRKIEDRLGVSIEGISLELRGSDPNA